LSRTRSAESLRDWLGARDSRSWDDAVLGACSMLCMQYSLYAVLGACRTWCQLRIITCRYREGQLNLMLLGDGRVEGEKEGDET